jgi:glycosyltransferase involved in cell wall biosynthesis
MDATPGDTSQPLMRSRSTIMLSSRLYYLVKPIIPRSIRMTLRRIPARRRRRTFRDVWPINPAAGKRPTDWTGWPLGRQFSFVLTHDVEGADGLERCRRLANLELELGFRSSFNFIPEGSYRVPESLITWLMANGFEVGVHDLRHNGKLFQSRAAFAKNSVRINQYIRRWGAVGFRSAFMLRNLDWLHELDIGYDASTFDTDPFEPQPEGTGTIFPFWVPSAGVPDRESIGTAAFRGGYVELPYTLPQDSTLYLLLGEKTPSIWNRKLDWIAKQGGMALVNVHPDYINFDSGRKSPHKYDASIYASFLKYVSQTYSGLYWNALPRDLASWYVAARPAAPARKKTPVRPLQDKRALVLLYSSYPADPRPRRAAEALVAKGMRVEVLCLKGADSEATEETVGGVHVRRLPLKHHRGGKLNYIGQYVWFIVVTFCIVSWRAARRRYSLVHVHNMPDVLVFSALVPKLLGAKVILDLHDPMPELMRTIFGLGEGSLSVRLLKFFEKLSIGFSDAVITVNRACKGIFSRRSCEPGKIAVIMNSPDEGIFQPRRPEDAPRRVSESFVIMYHGSLVERHGLDLAVDALARILPTVPRARLRIYGQQTPFLTRVLASVRGTPLEEHVEYFGPKTLKEIVQAIEDCDVGIIPNRKSIFTEINTPTRIFEYLSQSKPVIAPRVPGILDYFGPDELFYFNLGDSADLARQLLVVAGSRELVAETVAKGGCVYREHMWSSERSRFIELVSETLSEGADQSVALKEAI